jgi:hypothetical protein
MVLSLEDWGPITAQQIVVQQESTHVSHIEVIEIIVHKSLEIIAAQH